METELCACGRPLHYSDKRLQEMVEDLVKEKGPTVLITVDHRTWMVPRHYLALHGLRGDSLPSLGFTEVGHA